MTEETKRKVRLGQVVSDRMDKTVVVEVSGPKRHPLYKKIIRRVARYKVHDEKNECRVGDKVRIVETRPLSREKRWRVAEILVKGEVVEISPEEITQEELDKVISEKKVKEAVAEIEPETEATEELKEETKPEAKTKTKAKAKEETKAEAKEKAKAEIKEEKEETEAESSE
jgi:small subunit ribosomal protein S17